MPKVVMTPLSLPAALTPMFEPRNAYARRSPILGLSSRGAAFGSPRRSPAPIAVTATDRGQAALAMPEHGCPGSDPVQYIPWRR